MAMTARGLARAPGLGLSLVAGAAGADREIAWAHAIELADPTPYLSGGELVMTTGITLGAGTAAQFDYVARLAAAGVAALAVDTGTTFAAVPDGVRTAGDRLGLPVLRVPPSTPFIAIARVVIDAVTADEVHAVHRVVDRQEVLARATLRGGIPAVVAALADCLAAAVVVVDNDGRALAAGGDDTDRLVRILADGATGRGGYVTADGAALVSVQTLRAARPVRGRLAVRTAGPLSHADRLVVAHAVSLISIALEKPARVVDAEQRLRTAVTAEMVCGRGVVDAGVLRYFGFDPGAEVVVLVLRGVGPVLTAEHDVGRLLAAGGPYLMTVTGRGGDVMGEGTGDEIVAVLPAAGGRGRAAALAAELVPAPGGGLSRPVPLGDVALGLEQARIAARGDTRRFTDFTELGALGVLLGGRGPAELRVLAAPLDPLEGDADLVATLEAFLRCNGHLETAAAQLGVHRHTMRNRMRRIRDALGDDLESAGARAQLWLAVNATRVVADRRAGQDPSRGGPLR